MGTFMKMAKQKARSAHLPSQSEEATLNRAGGVSFDIKDPAVKLVTMTGGSFFAEPKYYDADACVPKRLPGGGKDASLDKKFDKLVERIHLNKEKASAIPSIKNCGDLDEVSQEIIATAWDILGTEHPKDLLSIAHWLRQEMNIRLTPQVLLVLASRHPNVQKYVREYATKIIQRPDEVKTCILMHRFFFGMKTMANCLHRGLSDAMHKFGERGLMKYDEPGFPTWKDALLMVHRKKGYPLSAEMCRYFINGETDAEKTPIAHKRKLMSKCKVFDGEAQGLAKESMVNWEVLLSQFGQTPEGKKAVWEFLVGENLVGYMAMMRNIRNLLEAGVSMDTLKKAHAKLSDPEEVKRSRQLPFRFATAMHILKQITADGKQINLMQDALENAADIACENVPELPGLTCVFADNSGSMDSPVSAKSQVTHALAANILGGIVAKRGQEARICAFGDDVAEVNFTKRTRVLEFVEKLARADTKGCSTNTHRCVEWMIANKVNPDRVIILSDMQCWDTAGGIWGRSSQDFADLWRQFSAHNRECWLHSVNLSGYGDSMTPQVGKVNLVGGFSEKVLTMLLTTEGKIAEEALPTIDQIRTKW